MNVFAVGLDTSLTGTGLAAVNLDTGTWAVSLAGLEGHRRDNINTRYVRLSTIRDRIIGALGALDGRILLAGIEGPSYSSKFGSPWDRAGLWWMVINELRVNEVPVALVVPQGRAKYATGTGTANKAAVLAAARARYPVKISNDNIGDAVVIASMMARRLGVPVDDPLDDKNLEAMGGVEWPE